MGGHRSSQVEILQTVREQHAAVERRVAEAESALERRLDAVEDLAQVSKHAGAGYSAQNPAERGSRAAARI